MISQTFAVVCAAVALRGLPLTAASVMMSPYIDTNGVLCIENQFAESYRRARESHAVAPLNFAGNWPAISTDYLAQSAPPYFVAWDDSTPTMPVPDIVIDAPPHQHRLPAPPHRKRDAGLVLVSSVVAFLVLGRVPPRRHRRTVPGGRMVRPAW